LVISNLLAAAFTERSGYRWSTIKLSAFGRAPFGGAPQRLQGERERSATGKCPRPIRSPNRAAKVGEWPSLLASGGASREGDLA